MKYKIEEVIKDEWVFDYRGTTFRVRRVRKDKKPGAAFNHEFKTRYAARKFINGLKK